MTDRRSAATKAVLLDALGTLIELEPPWPHLADDLGVDPSAAERAMRAEMSYYRDHAHEAFDEASLRGLRERCAALISAELGREVSVERMMAAIRFRAAPDAAPALDELRRRGLRLVCVSNWDYALPAVIERCGLGGSVDAVVTSAGAGARKPDPAIFRIALDRLNASPAEAVMVGDSWTADIEGARAAGIRAIWFNPFGAPAPDGDVIEELRSLEPTDAVVRTILDPHRH
jgi:HAD superfamily hydrolase (TIGR01509 family)